MRENRAEEFASGTAEGFPGLGILEARGVANDG